MGWFWREWQLSKQPKENSSNDDLSSPSARAPPSPDLTSSSSFDLNTLFWCTLTATTALGAHFLYGRYIRRIPNIASLDASVLRKRSLYGYVTRVGDGDNFRFYHTPLGRIAGWHSWRKIPTKARELTDQTLHVRIAGIDAPELPHWGQEGQLHGQEALEWLTNQVLHRNVRVWPLSKDQYGRVVARVKVRRWWRRDVGLEMLRAGWAQVYEAKKGAEYGGREAEYRAVQERAKTRGLGMWGGKSLIGKWFGGDTKGEESSLESPRDFKKRMKEEKEKDVVK